MAGKTSFYLLGVAVLAGTFGWAGLAQETVPARKSIVLEGRAARVVLDLSGGSIAEFRLAESALNPLSWAAPGPGDRTVQGFGHFLCLDRWGPPSEAEGAKGMPYHGEASHVEWSGLGDPVLRDGVVEARMTAVLPMAGLRVQRTVRLSSTAAVLSVREEIRNENALGRIYNMVQHPTIAPPFLDESTLVDCSGTKGFAQGGSLPEPESRAFIWPNALKADGTTVDMRRLARDPNPNVVSYTVEGDYGWVTAATPIKRLLIGYIWKRGDYPWVSLWRDVRDGHPAARGLEFGTTGLHQPFPILVQKGRIWGRPLFEYLDAGQTTARSYLAFLLKISEEFTGVESIRVDGSRVILRLHSGQAAEVALDTSGVMPN